MPKKSAKTIRVRMYRVGFGDCFLLSLPVENQQRHILVDCGVHSKGNIATMKDVVDNIATVTQRKLAIVIASHAHQDHISGFGSFSDRFKEFEIGEVWLPWTENPEDVQASKLEKKHLQLVRFLSEHFNASPVTSPLRAAAVEAIANLSGNQKALQMLRSGFEKNLKPQYLEAGQKLDSAAGIEGLTATVLGPPRDEKFLARMNPPEDQRYLRAGTAGLEETMAQVPFSDKWKVKKEELSKAMRLSEEEEARITQELMEDSSEQLALLLDSIRNNTSLVVLFSYRGQNMLFPGDAQYGNWRHWLDQDEAENILTNITFLKVAHHGSHNATPKDALEGMTGLPAAMVSTQNVPWESIPRMPLMNRLSEICNQRVMRSDSLKIPNTPVGPDISKLPKGFRRGKLWFDYSIKV